LLTVLGGLAEFERELIRVRTGEGRRRAVEAGVKLCRRSSLTTYQQAEVFKRRAGGETLKALARSYGVTHPTIVRALRKNEAPIQSWFSNRQGARHRAESVFNVEQESRASVYRA